MQPAPSPVFYEPPLAAKPQLREKPHQGLPSKNPTWNQGPNVCNFTVTLGLRATVVENGVGQTYSARYYNPSTGRFLSRDPQEYAPLRWAGTFDSNGNPPIDPKKLHKYLYAGGDPVNKIDPRGREMFEDVFIEDNWIDKGENIALKAMGTSICITYSVIASDLIGLTGDPRDIGLGLSGAYCGSIVTL